MGWSKDIDFSARQEKPEEPQFDVQKSTSPDNWQSYVPGIAKKVATGVFPLTGALGSAGYNELTGQPLTQTAKDIGIGLGGRFVAKGLMGARKPAGSAIQSLLKSDPIMKKIFFGMGKAPQATQAVAPVAKAGLSPKPAYLRKAAGKVGGSALSSTLRALGLIPKDVLNMSIEDMLGRKGEGL